MGEEDPPTKRHRPERAPEADEERHQKLSAILLAVKEKIASRGAVPGHTEAEGSAKASSPAIPDHVEGAGSDIASSPVGSANKNGKRSPPGYFGRMEHALKTFNGSAESLSL